MFLFLHVGLLSNNELLKSLLARCWFRYDVIVFGFLRGAANNYFHDIQ